MSSLEIFFKTFFFDKNLTVACINLDTFFLNFEDNFINAQ